MRSNNVEITKAKKIVTSLYDNGMIQTWYRHRPEGWRLASGLWSPFYIQLRQIMAYPELLREISEAMRIMILQELSDATQLIGVAMAGIPLSVGISLSSGIPCGMTRKMEGARSIEDFDKIVKAYGGHSLVEGNFKERDFFVLIDDLVTRFDSKHVAIRQVMYEMRQRKISNYRCRDVAVVLDREQGAQEAAQKAGVTLHALIPFRSRGLKWLEGAMSDLELEVIRDYLDDASRYQDESLQHELRKRALKL